MPLKLGSKAIADVYLGNKKISKIYKGDKLVYEKKKYGFTILGEDKGGLINLWGSDYMTAAYKVGIPLFIQSGIRSSYTYLLEDQNGGVTYIDLSTLYVGPNTSFAYLFYKCSGLKKVNFGNIDPDNISNTRYMFNSGHIRHIICTEKFKQWLFDNFNSLYNVIETWEIVD